MFADSDFEVTTENSADLKTWHQNVYLEITLQLLYSTIKHNVLCRIVDVIGFLGVIRYIKIKIQKNIDLLCFISYFTAVNPNM